MERTKYATHTARMADAARLCAGFGIGLQWRNVAPMAALKSANTATKRSARHLGMAPT